MKKEKIHFLSVIVPAYKQARTIQKDLKRIDEILQTIRYDYEIVCVIDGMIDKTFQEAKKLESEKIKVIGYEKNCGKGYAVRYGMAKAKGDIIAFIDAGMDINPKGIPMLLEHMIWYDSDVIVGSIRHSVSKVHGYPLKRKIYSWGYHFFTRLMFGLHITDSQRGIKIFKRNVLKKVLPRLLVRKYAFDIEMLAVANRLGFTKIHDGPVEMDCRMMKYSSVGFGTVWSMLIDTIAVFYRLRILRYYDDRNSHQWHHDLSLKIESDLNK